MKYWIGRNNQQLGPFELTEVQRMIVEGKIAVTDLAWAEGMPSWSPVSQVIPGAAPASAADLGKTQPLLGQKNPMPAAAAPVAPVPAPMEAAPVPAPSSTPAWAPPPAAAAPAQAQWTPPADPQPQWTPPAPVNAAPQQYQPQAPVPQYAPPQAQQIPQQYAPPQQQYRPAPSAGPVPPGMNWIVVLVLCMIPFFALFWFYKEFSFVKQIDAKSKALTIYFASFGLFILYAVLVVLGLLIGDTMAVILSGLGALCALGGVVCQIMAVFNARSSLLYYYNNVENIGLKLSPIMTFFFSLYYFQYHFQRIAEWKGGAPLRPQA